MMIKYTLALLTLVFCISTNSYAAKAYLAGGCFWCMEADFEKLPGVTEVISGFSGGKIPNPTYNGDHRGHYETVEIHYDSSLLSFQDILEHFWVNIDPFDPTGQFCDKGASYLAAIFVSNRQERLLAEISKKEVEDRFPNDTVVMPILPLTTFYPIAGEESYHQNYYKTHATRYQYYRWRCGRDARLADIWGEKSS